MIASVRPILVTGRLPRLRAALGELGAEAMVVSNLSNLRYLTGFSGSAGVLLVADGDAVNGGAVNGDAVLVTDGRYRIQAAEQLEASGVADVVELQVGRNDEQRQIMQSVLALWSPARLALEAESISWAGQRRWAQLAPEAELVPSSGLVEELRQVKDDAEIDHMARAAAVADDALAEVLPLVAEGRTEAEVALALDSAMRRLGAEESAFETIVASGPNAAKPHARPSERRLERGDPVVIDFGALYEGYRSDMTRTFFVGTPPTGVMAEVLDVVARAQ
ncbi:MAG TPA: Xaa-Pro peptidase family protein, partial [Acidimicrobiales bacterium]|nr:Xaa-Pro peptidase family protein [Acidimicrobiales bacterium]